MEDKLKDIAKNNDIEIPDSFNIKFEDALSNLPENKKYKYSKYSIAASIMLTVLVTSGVAMAISNGKYKYVPTAGYILENESKIYGLDEVIKKKDKDGNELALDMQIIEDAQRAIVNIGGMYFLPKSEKSELKIGNKVYENERTDISELEYSWGACDVFNGIEEYTEDEDVIYTLYLDKENKVSFNMKLKELEGVESYENLGMTSVYNNIPITAIVNENDSNMVVDFITDRSKVFITPGKDGGDGTFSAIYLLDANGKRVSGLREINNGSIKYSRVKFDTRDTQKPYKIVIPHVIAEFFVTQDENLYSEEIILDIPKDGESIKIDREVELNIESTGIKTNNDTVKLINGKRDGNKFVVNLEYPQNEKNNLEKDYLRQVIAIEEKLIGKDNQVFARSDFDENINLVHTLEFDVSIFKNKIKFRLSPSMYDMKGNWEFIIE